MKLRLVIATLFFAGLAPVASTPLAAQGVLPEGTWLEEKLAGDDATDTSGALYDEFRLAPGVSGRVEVTVESADFDTVLRWYATGGGVTDENDDFRGLASATDSRLYVEVQDGRGTFRVTSFGGSGEGSYRIMARVMEGSTSETMELSYGADVTDALAETDRIVDGAFVDMYAFQGSAGDEIQIAVEGDFDTFLTLFSENGGLLTTDDDGLGGTNSLIEITLPRDGRYEVMVSAYSAGMGNYRLRLGTDMGIEPNPDAMPVTDMPENILFTEAERVGLEEVDGALVHESLGFSIPFPGPDFFVAEGDDVLQGPNAQAWMYRDVMETAEFVVLAVKAPVPAQPAMLELLVEQMVSSLGVEPTERRDLWAEARSAEVDVLMDDGSKSQLRCTGDGGGREIGLIVCAIGQSSDGWSFASTLAGLRVQ